MREYRRSAMSRWATGLRRRRCDLGRARRRRARRRLRRVILVDTSGLLAALDAAQRLHREAAASQAAASPPLLSSPFVLAELDYLLATRVGLGRCGAERCKLQTFSTTDVRAAVAIIERHADLAISLADASIVVLASRRKVQDVLTLDQRHFRVPAANDKPFRLLPADH